MPTKKQPLPNMTNSVYVGGDTSGSIINVSGNTASVDYSKLLKLLKQIEEELPKLSLKDEQKAELSAEIKTVEAQISSPKPKSAVITEGLKTIRSLSGLSPLRSKA